MTLKRYPYGITGRHFYQKHVEFELPAYVHRVRLYAEEHGITEPALGLKVTIGLPWPIILDVFVTIVMTYVATHGAKLATKQ